MPEVTKPAEDGGPIVIAHVSDLHVGAHFPEVVDTLVTDVAAAGPTLTVITGDLTMRARRAQFVEAAALVQRLPSPSLVVPGNHDVPLAPVGRLRTPYAGYRAQIHSELDPFVQLPGLRALGLNSMPRWRWKSGRISSRQTALVTDVLGGGTPRTVRLLALHHPVAPRGSARVIGRGALVRALIQAKVDLVLTGHTHAPARHWLTPPGDRAHHVLEVTAGTATSRRDRGAGLSWTLISVHDDCIHVREHVHTDSGWQCKPAERFTRRSHP